MNFDFIVIGSGLSGLAGALVLAEKGTVALVTKGVLSQGATSLAQGGICAVVEKSDSFENHIRDTMIAGAYHNRKEAVEYMVRNAPRAIDWLTVRGVKFDMEDGKFSPTREAAHSHRRVLHAADFTGREIERALVEKVRSEKNIQVLENTFALDLIAEKGRCFGVKVLKTGPAVLAIFSKLTILATGGLGQIYKWTTNPKTATGDGVAMAVRAGCRTSDLEFVQFHPTALKHGKSPLFLLSEALRGEGAYLIRIKNQELRMKNIRGEKFMRKYDSRGELAPRDIVARAIFQEQLSGFEVYLDIRHKGKEFIKKRFPNIYKELKTRGFDLTLEPVPVTPAAHYTCGGVKTDLFGRTNIRNLFAFGEVACTGVHGANRLASNSLLEAVVFPLRMREVSDVKTPRLWRGGGINKKYRKKINIKDYRKKLQQLMWGKAGIIRERKKMKEALVKIKAWEKELKSSDFTPPGSHFVTPRGWLTLRNMLTAARLVTEAALKRKKSLGGHFVVNQRSG